MHEIVPFFEDSEVILCFWVGPDLSQRFKML